MLRLWGSFLQFVTKKGSNAPWRPEWQCSETPPKVEEARVDKGDAKVPYKC